MSRIKQFIVAGDEVRIPGWVIDYASFHKWTLSNAFPQSGRVDYIDDELWAEVDSIIEADDEIVESDEG